MILKFNFDVIFEKKKKIRLQISNNNETGQFGHSTKRNQTPPLWNKKALKSSEALNQPGSLHSGGTKLERKRERNPKKQQKQKTKKTKTKTKSFHFRFHLSSMQNK
ncbi:hypothetical protein ACOSP7_002780 [Xanthoceras sorbifolium]